eukprot:14851436-Alexandrium_andersonii.AAC.1
MICANKRLVAPEPPNPSLRWFLLPDHSPRKDFQIADMLRAKEKIKPSSADAIWRKKTLQMCEAFRIPYSSLDCEPEIKQAPYFNALPQREQHAIMVKLHCARGMGMTSLDTSQCVTRLSAGYGEALETVTPGSRIVLFPPLVPTIRGLTGYESMRIIGTPAAMLE